MTTKELLKKIDLQFFLVGLALILIGFLSFGLTKILEGYISGQAIKNLYLAEMARRPVDYSFLKPFRNWKIENPEIEATSALSLFLKENSQKTLFEKEKNKPLPIASLTKLLTAYLVIKNYDLESKVKITKKAIETEEDTGNFKPGEVFYVKDLLYSMLMESSNDAAMALAQIMGEKKFVRLMNLEAKKIGLTNTHFVDPIGLDPDFLGQGYNFSTAKDLATLIQFLIEEAKRDQKTALIWEILKTKEYKLYKARGGFHHKVVSTNKILDKFPDIFGGKTGYTPMAKECFVLVLKDKRGYFINIILGSKDRFGEMEKLINWINKAYIW
jgi:D-alanyl-D-alanine carboxypeptidase